MALQVDQLTKLKPRIQHPSSVTSHRPHFRINAASLSARELVQSGTVKTVLAKDAISTMNNEGFQLLDVRPSWEREKASVSGSLHVPLFVKDEDNSLITLLKKWVHFGYIGAWTGQQLTTINPDFVSRIETSVSDKDSKLLLVCGEGLRSLMAVTKLHQAGYKNLGWLAGGFNRSEDEDFPAVEGTDKLQYAAIGGASYYFLQILILLQAVGRTDNLREVSMFLCTAFV